MAKAKSTSEQMAPEAYAKLVTDYTAAGIEYAADTVVAGSEVRIKQLIAGGFAESCDVDDAAVMLGD